MVQMNEIGFFKELKRRANKGERYATVFTGALSSMEGDAQKILEFIKAARF